jgi:threonyl-tRNA synthetase
MSLEGTNEVVRNIMSDLHMNSKVREIYREVVKMLLIGSEDEENKKLKSFERELEKQKKRMTRLMIYRLMVVFLLRIIPG